MKRTQTTRRRWAGALAVTALLIGTVLVGAPPGVAESPAESPAAGPAAGSAAAPAAAPDPWQVAAKLARGDGPATSCPTVTTCWSVAGGDLLFSGDGGASWTPRTAELPTEVDALDALDCPTDTICFATGRLPDSAPVVVALRPGGMTATPVPTTGRLYAISCTSRSRCLATDGAAVVTTGDAGATWRLVATPLPAGVFALTCATGSTTCWGVGYYNGGPRIVRTANLGGAWMVQTAPATVTSLFAIDCPSTSTCYAVGNHSGSVAVAATTDGGATWAKKPVGTTSGALRSVSCPTLDTCWAFGSQFSWPLVFATSDAGASWASQALPTAFVGWTAASCPTVTTCASVGRNGAAFHTTTGGSPWLPVAVPASLGTVTELTCTTRTRCVGMTRDGALRPLALTTADGGRTWARHALPEGTGFVTDLDCSSPTTCHAWAIVTVSNNGRTSGQSLWSTDGGQTWQLRRGKDTLDLAEGWLSCPDPSTCLLVAIGAGGVPAVRSSVDGGRNWTTVAAPVGSYSLRDVSCASATSCVMLGRKYANGTTTDVVFATSDLGATSVAEALPAAGNGYLALDCAGSTCVAVGSASDWTGRIAGSTDGGLTWTARPVPGDAYHLTGVSCGRPAVCAVAAGDGSQGGLGAQVVGTVNGGRTWATIELPTSGNSRPNAIACTPYRASCLASDAGATGYPRILAGDA